MTDIATIIEEAWMTSQSARKATPDLIKAINRCPDATDFPNAEAFRSAMDVWWDNVALPAIEKAKGERS